MPTKPLTVGSEIHDEASVGFNSVSHQPNHEILEIVIASRFD
jgi:hypothetical protein